MESAEKKPVQRKAASQETGQDTGGKSGFMPHPEMAALQMAVNQSPQVQQLKAVQMKVNSGVQPVQMKLASIDSSGQLENHSDEAENQGIQKTNASFKGDALNSTSEPVGVKMVAPCLGPDHPQGSGPDTSVAAKHISVLNNKDKYIRGHLLNGDLGGPGDMGNLFPITCQANSLHYQNVEKEAKSLINDEKTYARYEVEVKNRNDKKGEADLECKLSPIDKKGTPTGWELVATIHSEPNNSGVSKLGRNKLTGNSNPAEKAGEFDDDDIEYQWGKMPVGFKAIPVGTEDLMRADSKTKSKMDYKWNNDLEIKLSNIISEDAIEEVSLFIQTRDPAVIKNKAKKDWNRWVKQIIANYK
jgi:hypothetical protein